MPGADRPRRRLDEAELRRLVDDLKARIRVSDVVKRRVKLTRCGREYKGLCPFHREKTASFYVNDAHGFGHCFGCAWHGDIIKFVQDTEGLGFLEAFERLADADLPYVSPEELAKAQLEEKLERLADEDDARRFWDRAADPAGTSVELYLKARGIIIEAPPCIRFGMVPSWRNKETGEWGRERPAMLCAITDNAGAVVGIQRVFFKKNQPRLGEADCKLTLGSVKGYAVRLGPADRTIIATEGPEDGLSILQEGPGFSVWVTLGTGAMPFVIYPPVVKHIIIAGQNNKPGRVAVFKAGLALVEQGFETDTAWPGSEYDDWNDQLRGRKS